MPSFVTPARLAALAGAATGLGAAVTSALDVIPHDTAIGRAVIGSVGVLGTVATISKFLEGQAGWEQGQAQQAHEVNLTLLQHTQALQRDQALIPAQALTAPVEPPAELPDEVPLSEEPSRLVAHETAMQADGTWQ